MKYYCMIGLVLSVFTQMVSATTPATHREPLLDNEQVVVWKTMIFPTGKNALPMHRHERNRVVIALSNGTLKITNDKGRSHYLKIEKDKAYYLAKDAPNELHNDENLTSHPITVIVIELKD